MSKRKRASIGKTSADPTASANDPTDDAAKDDMVHVTPDVLAGSPDIFAGKKADAKAESGPEDVEATAPAEAPVSEVSPQPMTPTEATTTVASAPAAPAAPAAAAPAAPVPVSSDAPSTPPPFMNATAYPTRRKRGASASALGIVLVVIGIFALAVVLSGVDMTQYGWPLFILIPGLTLMVVGFVSVGAVATIPGGILTMLGVVLAYASSTGDWPIWAYAWSLVVPGGIGLGMYLQALRDRDTHELHTGRTLLIVSVMIFLIGFVLFESILGISGRDYFGAVGKAALPVLLIVVGVILLVRSVQRNRRA